MSIGGSKTSQSGSQTVNLPPWLDQEWQSAIKDATAFSQQPVEAYKGNFSAPVNDTWNAATSGITNALKNGPGQAYKDAAGALTKNLGFTPSQVTASNVNAPTVGSTTGQAALINPGDVRDVTAGNVKDVSAYFNPYENSVVSNTLGDIQRQKDIALNGARARAAGAGAFGGSRSAILEAETGRSFNDAMARTAAELRQGGYAQAQNVAGQDANRALQAGMANQGRDMSIAGANQGAANDMTRTNLGFTNAAQQAQAQMQYGAATGNADRGLTAQQSNQSAGTAAAALQNSAAGQLAGMDATSRAQDGQFLQMLQTQGLNLQNLQNDDLQKRYTEFLRQQQVPYDQINTRLAALGLAPYNKNVNTTGSSSSVGFKLG